MFGKKTVTKRIERKVINHEQEMVEYAQKMCDYRRKATAVHVHLSRATGFGYDNYLYAINLFRSLVTRFDGKLFVLFNHDLVFAYHGPAHEPQVKDAVFKVRLLFDVASESSLTNFASWYDLELDYKKFLELSENILAEKNKRDGAAVTQQKSGPMLAGRAEAEAPEPGVPSLETLHQFMTLFDATDVSTIIRRQPVCRITADGEAPQLEFHELFVSIADLEKKLMPNIRLASDRNLFQYLTNSLDRRVLGVIKTQVEVLPAANFSLNLNVASFLTQEFEALDAVLTDEYRRTIVLEFGRVDVLADIGRFLVVRDRAKERGYRVCMDGLSHVIMPYVRLQDMGLDLLKVNWNPEMASGADPEALELLKGVVERCGRDRMILCHCDNDEAVKFGLSLGITQFQGRHIDSLFAAARKN